MSRSRQHVRPIGDRQSAVVIDLHDYFRPEARPGRPAVTLEGWRVVDDWPRRVPVTEDEVDVFEAWFGDILDELFGPI